MNQIVYSPISDERVKYLADLAKKHGSCIHVLNRVKVHQGLDWDRAIDFKGSLAHDNQRISSEFVRNQYPAVSNLTEEIDVILLNNLKANGGWNTSISWGEKAGLKTTNPREVFALVEQKTGLGTGEFNCKAVYLVPTVDFASDENERHACCVWVGNEYSSIYVFKKRFFTAVNVWFAFREPPSDPVQ